jgi:tRNA G18 (ribose-2'-O)-methylase SpoU
MLDLADYTVHIPMLGDKSSLNVSVAAGIVMY